MKCARCQHENREGAKFCEECAAPLARACANCGAALSATAKFCSECAHPAGRAGPAPASPRFGAPQAYTPQHLAEKILTSKAALEGERKQVTVLFADLKGSMELLADRDPEEARALLDPVLQHMMDAVHRYEGTVNQVMGDGIMALFGAPLAHEDHAVRACYAALQMQASIGRYADELRHTQGRDVHIRVGMNSGEVVVRSIGSDLHMDYTAVGQTTHLAARMEQMAMPGAILMTPATLRLAEGAVQVKPLGLVPVKGLAEPIEVYEVTSAAALRSRLEAAAVRGLTRFVGRAAEIGQLRLALEQARAGRGQVAAIVGEPGVGKSRLVWECTHSHRSQGWLVLEAASVSYGKATTYFPVIDLLRRYFQIEGRDDSRKIREKVTGKLLSLDRALQPTLPVFLSLLDVPVDDPEWAKLDPPRRRQLTLDALKRLFVRESQVQPLLLVFEDLHWIDSETQALLDVLVDSVPTARLLFLVNYRPEYTHGWGSKTYYQQLRLDTLPTASAGELLEVLLGADPGLSELRRLLIERTQGNPFFLEEMVRALVETKVLTGEHGAYRLAGPIQNIQLPPTVQNILAARIDRLAPEDKQLLQTASVVGKDVSFALLQAVAELPDKALRSGLDNLRKAEFLYETRLFHDPEYTFKHALTHEVAYGSLLQERRRVLHASIVEASERLCADRLPEQAERLAHHALRGEVWDKALAYCRQAGEKAIMRSAYSESVGYFEQALNALPHLPEQHATREQAIDLRLALRTALQPSGDFGRILVCLREAETLAEALDDSRRLAQISLYLSRYFSLTGTYEQAITAAQRALTLGTASGDSVLPALANLNLGLVYAPQADYRRAIDCFGQTVAALDGARRYQRFGQVMLPAVQACAFLAWCHAELGTFAKGRTFGEEGLRIAEAVEHPASRMVASWGGGLLALHQGDLGSALPLLERAMAIYQDTDLPIWFCSIAAALGAAYTLGGRIADAMPLLTLGLEREIATKRPALRSCSLSLGEAHLLAGRLEEAHALVMRTLAREHQERHNQAYALRFLGEIAVRREPPQLDQAGDDYRQALTLAEELGMRPLAAHCHLGLGKLYRLTGQLAQARDHLTTAITMYREMDMRFWLEQAEEMASHRPIVGQADGP
jgi:class 3 adenylate cyclase/tetratricopeptide (TPR) repeat protein